jgi:flagellar assembly protein FliH
MDLSDIEAQARRILSEAQAKAFAILEAAERAGRDVRERAQKEGREGGLAAGREEGLAAGRAQGRKEAFDGASKEIASATEGLVESLRQFAERKDGLFTQAESDLLKLSLVIARKVVAREVAADAHVTAANVKRCLEMLSQRKNLVIRVAPGTLAVVEEALPEMGRKLGDLSSVKVLADESVSPGGCLVTGESGMIDATMESQLEEVERVLFGEANA